MSGDGAIGLRVALAGNPNVGKTSLFNELTGARHKVGNYAGVTVEIREGAVAARWRPPRPITVIDLPGTYSLTPMSEDEAVAFRCLHGEVGPAPDLVVLVVDAANLARNLYLAMQLCELGRPLVLALNMMDVAVCHCRFYRLSGSHNASVGCHRRFRHFACLRI